VSECMRMFVCHLICVLVCLHFYHVCVSGVYVSLVILSWKETIELIKGEHKKKGEKSTYTIKRKPKWRYPPRAKSRPIQHI